MADEEYAGERQGSCIMRCGRTPLPDLAPVCGPCRSRIRNQLREIGEWYAELEHPPAAPPARRSEDLRYPRGHDQEGKPVPLAAERLPAGTVPGRSSAPRVAGSREAPVPISVNRVDLLGDADERTVHDRTRVPLVAADGGVVRAEKTFRCRCGRPELHANQPARAVLVPARDQVGEVSVATVLDGWCRDFAETRRESTPEPAVALQCRHLLDRWDWACAEHAAVDEFASEVGDVWHALRCATGRTEPRAEHCAGVPCKSLDCDLKTLYRVPGSDYIECESCGSLLTEAEYQDWLKLLRAPLCGKRNGDWWCALPKRHADGCAPAMIEVEDVDDVAA